jgi:uncharacterized membrane protein YqaE (UPF0057 family)
MEYKILLNFENKNILKQINYSNTNKIENINANVNTIFKEIFQDIINDEISDKNTDKNNNDYFDINEYFFIKDGVIINSNTKLIDENQNTNHIISLECHRRIKGGSILDSILDVIFGVFDPIVKPILAIGECFIFLLKALFWLIKFMIWLVEFVMWILFDLLNPINFFTEFTKTLMLIVVTVCKIPFDLILVLYKMGVNTIAGWMQGFWGWDMSSLTKRDKNSPYFKSFDKNKGQKVYYTNSNTVPFSIILGTIICPPMGVFMDLGLSGWLNIIVCCLLTLLFYIPGLCYALLIIYS